MVETKTLLLTVEEVPVGEAVMRFDSYAPPLDTREIFPVGAPWPSVTKIYKPGESVYVHYAVKNIGTGPGVGSIEVKDLDTGAVITTWAVPELAQNERFKTTPDGSGAYVGKMPDKDWSLSIKVTP